MQVLQGHANIDTFILWGQWAIKPVIYIYICVHIYIQQSDEWLPTLPTSLSDVCGPKNFYDHYIFTTQSILSVVLLLPNLNQRNTATIVCLSLSECKG